MSSNDCSNPWKETEGCDCIKGAKTKAAKSVRETPGGPVMAAARISARIDTGEPLAGTVEASRGVHASQQN